MRIPKLSVIVPCFNEEEVLPRTVERLYSLMEALIKAEKISSDSFLLFVDDGSKDRTPDILKQANTLSPDRVKYVKFARNFGNQSAILAGLKESCLKSDADCVVSIDADLQQDENKITDFIDKMNEGYHIVAGVKRIRGKEPLYKRITAGMFYKTMNFLDVKIRPNHSEYRLLTRYAIEQLMQYPENGFFLRGLIAELNLKTAHIEYDVKPRELGSSKFSFASLLKLGFLGLVSHSTKPLTLIFVTGLIVTLACFLVLTVAVILEFLTPKGLPNVHFFEVLNTFLSGILILCLGIIGQYIGQILLEVKNRPKYLIEEEKI